MMKYLLFPFFTLLFSFSSSLYAQEVYQTNCTMEVEEILLQQSWDIDHPKSEDARNITLGIFAELALIYDKLNNGLSNELTAHLQAIASFIVDADQIGMNYSMFETDLTFIESLN